MDILRDKGCRTVYRLTLVKGFNMNDLVEYGELIRRGRPHFVEIKVEAFIVLIIVARRGTFVHWNKFENRY